MNSTAYRFTIEQSKGRFHIYRDGEPCGAKLGYETRGSAMEAIAETKRWDRIAG